MEERGHKHGSATRTAPHPQNHVVLLVPGSRTFARWQDSIRFELGRHGLAAHPTNYGYFDALQLLLPVPWLRRKAILRVWDQVRDVRRLYPHAHISFIAHSFGTYIVAEILRREFDFRAHRVIFCGSIVQHDFPFEQIAERFCSPIMNECATHDVWPVAAESVTWGYGSAGTFGFRGPRVFDRWHNGARHSDVLNEAVCRAFWVPFLACGELIEAEERRIASPIWFTGLKFISLRWVLPGIIALVLGLWAVQIEPTRYEVRVSPGFGFPGEVLRVMHNKTLETCRWSSLIQFVRGQSCVRFVWNDEIEKLVVFTEFDYTDRDPVAALRSLAQKYDPCLRLPADDDERGEIRLNADVTTKWVDRQGNVWYLCNHDAEGLASLNRALGA